MVFLETIDLGRIVQLVEDFADYAEYLVVRVTGMGSYNRWVLKGPSRGKVVRYVFRGEERVAGDHICSERVGGVLAHVADEFDDVGDVSEPFAFDGQVLEVVIRNDNGVL
ncbi:hypothetical protein KTS45_19005 [Halomicroarcula limicola]|uniref:Uncharacterized protein n=1 Tax=Haloarcula limicola TaxID=1429915 RepID=A0A8J7YFJ5_9EURY|nr:hypothetical protein [Halomicroarcula limicola]MBV0926301.1 hypothetical protein [Halomicroarcula limicola]